MTFRTPQWLWLLPLVPFATVFFIARERHRIALARRFASERLRGLANPARVLRPYVLTLASAAAALALAGPYRGFTTVPVVTRDMNRVIAIDVSHSMAAEDIGTSRLSGAKAIARRLIENHSGRVALIAFEGSAEVVSPLTNDTDAVLALLDTMQTGEVGHPGSDIGAAVLSALRLVEGDVAQKADVVIISDGEEQGRRLADATRRARASGVQVSAIVIGSENGSSIPAEGGVLRDESGEIITTYARPDILERAARGTGGIILDNPFAERALAPLLLRGVAGAERSREVRVPIDRYQWPLAFAVFGFLCASVLNRGAE
jgi:Ca-activated chloride channel family protein